MHSIILVELPLHICLYTPIGCIIKFFVVPYNTHRIKFYVILHNNYRFILCVHNDDYVRVHECEWVYIHV